MMEKRTIWRVLFGALIAAFGGVSLTRTVYLFVLGRYYDEIPLDVLLSIFGFTAYIALLWALGGGLVGWWGGARSGGIILGLCGLLAGFLLSAFVVKGGWVFILLGTVVGLAYGAPGGLIMGWLFPNAAAE
jgi:hypothetical protein